MGEQNSRPSGILKLVPKDPEPVKSSELPSPAAAASLATKSQPVHELEPMPASQPGATHVSVIVDQIALPGTLVSGKVAFSDGQKAEWSLDQTGKLGLTTQQKGYRPSQSDVQAFQQSLQTELAKMGF